MPVQFALPDLGENIESGDVIRILVDVGDSLAEDQTVIELETDKAVIEVPSSVDGTITEILVQQGDTIAVGQPILEVEAGEAPAVEEASPAAEPAPVPQESATAPVVEEAPNTPYSATAPIGAAPVIEEAPPTPTSTDGPVPAAPSTRRLAREIGVDIAQVQGTGPSGRISIDDVKAYSKKLHAARVAAPAAAAPLPDFSQWGAVERQPMTKVREITADRLAQAWATIPQVTQFDKADITSLEKWRAEYGKKAEAAGGKLTPTAILIKVLGIALKVFPQFNASIDIAQREVVYKRYFHIGIAVDTPHGLLVPVVRDVDQKNIIELAVELSELAQKTRERKIGPADMQGGSMTISNVGTMGGTAFTPIVNPPEVAIL
ncbi:MAG: 2-oxo acid dehydrogenase subunit E2, partial [Gemmatimonadota bacterium]|nr:2-oxo acid dehydrogenase subunit E2 [Gemmatimonadota bacterium]